jgi:hypothetical protein
VSTAPAARSRSAETIAGFLAAVSIFASSLGLLSIDFSLGSSVEVNARPLRVIPAALVLALVAAAIGGRHARLAAFAVGFGALCFALGLTFAVASSHPLW